MLHFFNCVCMPNTSHQIIAPPDIALNVNQEKAEDINDIELIQGERLVGNLRVSDTLKHDTAFLSVIVSRSTVFQHEYGPGDHHIEFIANAPTTNDYVFGLSSNGVTATLNLYKA